MARIRKRTKKNIVSTKPRGVRRMIEISMLPIVNPTLLPAAPWGKSRSKGFLERSARRVLIRRSMMEPRRIRSRPQPNGKNAGPGSFGPPKGNVADQMEMLRPRRTQNTAMKLSLRSMRCLLRRSLSQYFYRLDSVLFRLTPRKEKTIMATVTRIKRTIENGR